MSYLIDDVARTLASPIPRRQAFRYILGALISGTVFAPLAMAACDNSKVGCPCTGGVCTGGLTCTTCGDGSTACSAAGTACCKPGNTGSGNNYVPATLVTQCCCNGNATASSGSNCRAVGCHYCNAAGCNQ